MRVLAIVHQLDAGPGVFADAIRDSGAELAEWLFVSSEPPGDPFAYDAVLTFGGAMHPDQSREHPWLTAEIGLLSQLLDRGVPLLGVCLGAELLAAAAAGRVGPAARPEIGWYAVRTTREAAGDPVIGPLAPGFDALEWHSYEFSLPVGATPLARSETCHQAYRLGTNAWGIQFHAEVTARDLESWIDDYRSDPDAVALKLDPDSFRSENRRRMADWNQLGRELCERFLAAAAGFAPLTS